MSLVRQCPRFPLCSVNRCPLDDDYPNQFVDRHDREKRCTMEKGVRVRIAATAPGQLTLNGLTVAEHAAKLAFEQKPVSVRLAIVEKGKASLAKVHASNKLKTTSG
jgi:hypothetical protein